MFLVVVGCGSKTPVVSNHNAMDSNPAIPDREVVILKELQSGDRGCYVVVTAANGDRSLLGDFAVCSGGERDATGLFGHRVNYRTKKTKVMAVSCQGVPDCPDSDEVDLVIEISPAL